MSHIRSKNTIPERKVRSLLHLLGYRFRIHKTDLPGKPDIVMPRYRLVIFVHGCFWHNHNNCQKSGTPKSKIEFWESKIERNVERDHINTTRLKIEGWNVRIIWECETENQELLKSIITEIMSSVTYS